MQHIKSEHAMPLLTGMQLTMTQVINCQDNIELELEQGSNVSCALAAVKDSKLACTPLLRCARHGTLQSYMPNTLMHGVCPGWQSDLLPNLRSAFELRQLRKRVVAHVDVERADHP